MPDNDSRIARILIIHADPATRRVLDESLRRVTRESVSIHQAGSLSEGVQAARWFDPEFVVLDLDNQHGLALDVSRELRRPDRQVIGIFNPLLRRQNAEVFFRQASRAGVGDFIPLPASDDELSAALAARAPIQKKGGEEGRVVTFFSQQGGVGVTTLAVNTATALATRKQRGETALCDAVLQFGNAATHLSIAPDRDLSDLVKGLEEVEALATYLSVHQPSGLRVLASPQEPLEAEQVTPQEVSRVLLLLRRRFHTVIVDTPPVLDLMTLSILDISDLVFVVTEGVAPTVLATARFLGLMESQGFARERQRLVVNRHADFEGNLSPGSIGQQVGRPVDYVVPFDRSVVIAANQGQPMVLGRQKSEFSQAISRLADDVVRPIHSRS